MKKLVLLTFEVGIIAIFMLNIYVSDSTFSEDFRNSVSKQNQVDSSSIYPSWFEVIIGPNIE